jgi:hypothetical protein
MPLLGLALELVGDEIEELDGLEELGLELGDLLNGDRLGKRGARDDERCELAGELKEGAEDPKLPG